jgi:hypothetical protein
VLDDFVLGFLGAAAFDEDVARAESRDRIYTFNQPNSHIHMHPSLTFTDVSEPDILQCAGCLAVDALKLVDTDDHVA